MSNSQCDNKKEEILNAAEKEFILHGYAGARTVAIAKRAGVGHPLLHYHFKTKKDLFKFVVLRKIDLLRQSVLMSWDESDRSFPEKLSATIGEALRLREGQRGLPAVPTPGDGAIPKAFH